MTQESEHIKVEDNSGDHAYFTMIPNMLIDTLDACALTTYIIMKRLSGESQKPVWISKRYLMKQLRVGYPRVQEILDSLNKVGAVSFLGEGLATVKGVEQKVSYFSVQNIWADNIAHFKTKFDKGVSVQQQGVFLPSNTGVATQQPNKNILNKKDINKNIGAHFEDFWKAYPKKKSKGDAEKAWQKLNPSKELFESILNSIAAHKKSRQWTEDNGRYIPYPATFIRAKGWEDEVEVMAEEQVYSFKS